MNRLNRRDMLKVSAAAAPLAGIPMARVEAESSDPRPCYGPACPPDLPPDYHTVERRAVFHLPADATAPAVAAKVRANLPIAGIDPADLPFGDVDLLAAAVVTSRHGEASREPPGSGIFGHARWHTSPGCMIEVHLVTRRPA